MDIKVIVFDVDGTLVNVEERFYHYYSETLASFGIEPLDRETYEIKRKQGILSEPIPDVGEMRGKFWLDFIDSFSHSDIDNIGRPFPGIPEALERLEREGYPMGIVTGRTCVPDRVRWELDHMDIGRYFRSIMTNDEGMKGMNKSGKLLETATLFGVVPIQCAYIGDWEGDVMSAREAGYGLNVAVLSGGEGREALERHGPDVILESAARFPDYLEGVLKPAGKK